jgi:hypothetical protein
MLEIEPMALYMLGKHPTTELSPVLEMKLKNNFKHSKYFDYLPYEMKS